jgi:hypothetical protein
MPPDLFPELSELELMTPESATPTGIPRVGNIIKERPGTHGADGGTLLSDPSAHEGRQDSSN